MTGSISLDERINERLEAGETILNVIRALERADSPVESAADLRWIIIGMEEPSDVPDENAINGAIKLLSHSSLGVVERVEDGYQTVTNYENAVELLQSLDSIIQSVNE
ncbi:restriction endonuclease [Halovalidus salilacus]|uniref:restriction endonuclease n=1 Tax=Halovalidus salilacus TaxID=3075124 RepID=UPI003616FDEA